MQLAPSAFLASAAASSELAHMILPTNMQQTQLSYVDEALVIWSQGCQEQPLTGVAAHHQKSWDSLRLFSMADTLLKNTTDELNRARLLAASCKESGAWLNALPITSLGYAWMTLPSEYPWAFVWEYLYVEIIFVNTVELKCLSLPHMA